jgi:hypothetical protein
MTARAKPPIKVYLDAETKQEWSEYADSLGLDLSNTVKSVVGPVVEKWRWDRVEEEERQAKLARDRFDRNLFRAAKRKEGFTQEYVDAHWPPL